METRSASPERLRAVLDALDDAGLARDRRAASPAQVVDLERVHPADHVANGQNRRFTGLIQLINLYITALIQAYLGIFQAEVIQHRAPAGGVEHRIGRQYAAILQGGQQAAVGLFVDFHNVAVELQVHAALAQFLLQMCAYRAIEAAEEQVAPVNQ